jgi:hypothetical protein
LPSFIDLSLALLSSEINGFYDIDFSLYFHLYLGNMGLGLWQLKKGLG